MEQPIHTRLDGFEMVYTNLVLHFKSKFRIPCLPHLDLNLNPPKAWLKLLHTGARRPIITLSLTRYDVNFEFQWLNLTALTDCELGMVIKLPILLTTLQN